MNQNCALAGNEFVPASFTSGTQIVIPESRDAASPYSIRAHLYAERGYPVLPVMPGSKVPGLYTMGVHKPMFAWQTYADRLPTDTEREIWSDWPDCGICMPMGGKSGLIAIDVDTDDQKIIKAIETELHGLLICRRRGARGYAAFVRDTGSSFSKTKWNVSGKRVLDLLGYGRQVVLPKTVHPDIGVPYQWLTQITLENTDRDELPECPADLVERIDRAIAPFLTQEDREQEARETEVKLRRLEPSGESDFREVNDAAMANLDAWVPTLIPSEYLKRSHDGGYRAKPFWRGVTDSHKCGIHPTGIEDFAAGEKLTPLDLVMRVQRHNKVAQAMDWLAPRVGVDRAPSADLSRFAPEFFEAPPARVAPTVHEHCSSGAPTRLKEIAATRFTLEELTATPGPIDYCVKPWFPKGKCCALVGAGGTSKTTTLLMAAIHVCLGTPLFGHPVTAGGVLYVSAEDDRETLRRILFTNLDGLTEWDRRLVTMRLHVADVVGLGVKLTRADSCGLAISPDVDAIVAQARAIPDLQLVCFDTASRLNGGAEDNEGFSALVEAMERVARATGAAVIITHHTGKAQMREGIVDQYSSRGGTALSDNTRSVLVISEVKSTDKEKPTNASDLIASGELLRLSHVKANGGRKAPPVYLKRESTMHGARLARFFATFDEETPDAVWKRIRMWLQTNSFAAANGVGDAIPHPSRTAIETAVFGNRPRVREAVRLAIERGDLIEQPHPEPKGARKTYLALPIVHADTVADSESSAANDD